MDKELLKAIDYIKNARNCYVRAINLGKNGLKTGLDYSDCVTVKETSSFHLT